MKKKKKKLWLQLPQYNSHKPQIKRTQVSQIKIKTYSKKKKESYLNIFQEAKQKN